MKQISARLSSAISESGEKSHVYRRDIDGLRAIAVTSVVLYHAEVPIIKSGYIGVDIFFVISGYLIGGIILRDALAERFRFIDFYARRARRILPALFVTVAFVCFAGWFLLGASDYAGVGATGLSTLLAVSNFSFWQHQGYFDPNSNHTPLLMTWSLGVEEQFYIFFPFIIIISARWFYSRILITLGFISLASFLVALWCMTHYPVSAFYLLPSRAWELGVGALLAAWQIEHNRNPRATPLLLTEIGGFIGLGLVIASATCIPPDAPFPGLLALPPVFGAALLLWSEDSIVNRRLLAARPMVFIGLVSYSWYLWHWPLLSYLHIVSVDEPGLYLTVTTGLIALGCAILSWRFVEQPFRRRELPPTQSLFRYAVVLGLLCALTGFIKSDGGLTARLSDSARAVEETIHKGLGNCVATWEVRTPDLSENCVARRGGPHGIALIGDSHATALGPGLRDLAAVYGWNLAILTKASCGPLLGAPITRVNMPNFTSDCNSFVENELRFVVGSGDFDIVILAAYWSASSDLGADAYLVALRNSVRMLRTAGKDVVLVQDVPGWRLDPVAEAWADTVPIRGEIARAVWFDRNEPYPAAGISSAVSSIEPWFAATVTRVALETGANLVDLPKGFCRDALCRFKDGQHLLYVDHHHLSVYGSAIAAAEIFQQSIAISEKIPAGMRPPESSRPSPQVLR